MIAAMLAAAWVAGARAEPPPLPPPPSEAPVTRKPPPVEWPRQPAEARPNAIITSPAWVRLPTPAEVRLVFPKAAWDAQLDGRAVIECKVSSSGHLFACVVLNEAPMGKGFGDAALRLSKIFLMRPYTRDGVPVAGGRLRVPLVMPLPNEPPPPKHAEPPRSRGSDLPAHPIAGDIPPEAVDQRPR